MEDIQQIYQEETGSTVAYNFASSGSLQQQIEQGAPIDIFISAAEKQMDNLQNKGLLVNKTRRNLLNNEVVLIVAESTTGVTKFSDLTKDEVKKVALGEPASVPVGQYGLEVLSFLKLADQLKSKFIYAKDVRQVLTYIETGNVDAGIVYQTDAKQSDIVTVVAKAPKSSHSPIIYPVAVLKSSQNLDAAENFVQFLFSTQAGDVFEQYGFVKVSDPSPAQ